MRDTLLLNADGTPLSVAPLSTLTWQESIKLIWLDRIQVLEWHEDWQVRSPSITLTVPSVMMVREYVKPMTNMTFSRNSIYCRDNYICQYCREMFSHKDLTLDHVTPKSKGGLTNWINIVTACKKCNHKKADRTDVKPYRTPKKPDFHQLYSRTDHIHVDYDVWYKYINRVPSKKQQIA